MKSLAVLMELLAFSSKRDESILFLEHFNIDLLNPKQHKITYSFISTMYSVSLYPKMTRPLKILLDSATLINNIHYYCKIRNITVKG